MNTLTAFAWSLGFVCGACVAAHLAARPGLSQRDTSATEMLNATATGVENVARLVEGSQPTTMPQGDEADACVSCPACWIAASECLNVRGLEFFGCPNPCPSHESRLSVLVDGGIDLDAFEANMRHYVAAA